MVFRAIFIIYFLLGLSEAFSNIIYYKKNISITDIELNRFLNLNKTNYGNNISNNKAIKEIVLMKKTLNYLLKNNPEFISIIDQKIKQDFGEKIINDQFLNNYLRFQTIRNEFISEYFLKDFNYENLKLIYSSLPKIKLPLSKNNCLTIEKLHIVNNDEIFLLSFFENLKKNQKDFKTTIDNIDYNVCISEKLFIQIESVVINYIRDKTQKEFDEFIYGKIS